MYNVFKVCRVRLGESVVHGRGVFASTDISVGELIESCDLLFLEPQEMEYVEKSKFEPYLFSWVDGRAVFPIGYGAFYNHSYAPNAYYLKDIFADKIHFFSLDNIACGDEIFVNYNGGKPDSPDPVSFLVD